jgi:hypothetical protein
MAIYSYYLEYVSIQNLIKYIYLIWAHYYESNTR